MARPEIRNVVRRVEFNPRDQWTDRTWEVSDRVRDDRGLLPFPRPEPMGEPERSAMRRHRR